MRARILKRNTLFGYNWIVVINGISVYFEDFDTAMKHMNKTLKRMYKEASAYSMARTRSSTGLNLAEGELVRKLNKSKCKGITPKQWGYLKGIHERQQREW